MTITAAHIQPIVALIAGVLILIMPRFLNFVVAIYLIFIGLAGLGLFKMFKSGVQTGNSRLARDGPKWCKARISLPLSGLFVSHGQSRIQAQENRSEIKALHARPGEGRAAGPRPARR